MKYVKNIETDFSIRFKIDKFCIKLYDKVMVHHDGRHEVHNPIIYFLENLVQLSFTLKLGKNIVEINDISA